MAYNQYRLTNILVQKKIQKFAIDNGEFKTEVCFTDHLENEIEIVEVEEIEEDV